MELLKDLGVFASIILAITYLTKTLGKHLLDQNLKIHEMQLTQQLQRHKSELDLILQKAVKLHDHRLEKIQQFYSLLIQFHLDINQIIMIKNVTGKSDEEIEEIKLNEVKAMYNSGYEFSMFYQKNKLFFNKKTCELIDELFKNMKSSQFDLSLEYQWMNLSFEMIQSSFEKGKESLEKIIPKLKEELEDNFREVLGVQ